MFANKETFGLIKIEPSNFIIFAKAPIVLCYNNNERNNNCVVSKFSVTISIVTIKRSVDVSVISLSKLTQHFTGHYHLLHLPYCA